MVNRSLMQRKLLLGFALLLAACATAPRLAGDRRNVPMKTASASGGAPPDASADEAPWRRLLDQGTALLSTRPKQAITDFFEPTIHHYEQLYQNEKRRVYCVSTQAELQAYRSQAEFDEQDAMGIGDLWATAYFLKGYALIELTDADGAQRAFTQALTLSPFNSQYLSELGHIYQVRRDWDQAMATFTAALERAELAPPNVVATRKARALRGLGFCLTEYGRLNDAEEKFRKSLEFQPNNPQALNELAYLASLRSKQ